jgi:hypothetical protein
MYFLDGIFSHYKPTHDEALPHHCTAASATPLLQFTGNLLSGGGLGSSSRVHVVFGFFVKGLEVIVLL